MSGGTVVVLCAWAGLFIFWSVPEISWQNPPLQGYVIQVATYKVFASRSPQTPLKKGGFEHSPPF